MPFSQELPKYTSEALRPLLSIWERTGASERRLREEQLSPEMLSAVSRLFDIALSIDVAKPHYSLSLLQHHVALVLHTSEGLCSMSLKARVCALDMVQILY